MHAHAHTQVYIYTHMHKYTLTHVYACTLIHTHICTPTQSHSHRCTHTHSCTHTHPTHPKNWTVRQAEVTKEADLFFELIHFLLEKPFDQLQLLLHFYHSFLHEIDKVLLASLRRRGRESVLSFEKHA